MKRVGWVGLVVIALGSLQALAEDEFPRWGCRVDMGGTIPEDATLTEFGGPVSGEKFKLDPGFQFDVAGGYRFTPWLELGPELGFTFNSVNSIGGWSYPDTTLGQILMMANIRLEYPPQGRFAPFVGAGIGGAASFLTFGGASDYYYYYAPDGTGSDFSLAFQVFAGVRYRFNDQWGLGVQYRYLQTDPQNWNVEWWNGARFNVGIDALRLHSVCLVFTGTF